ncbi:MAG: hypothetical protein MUC97_14770 [Bernardetiaceae bacterium]|jgi:hypothetical protein|nr:hypothetical protein [Bernardetiaceae bacterium]
MPQPLPQLQVLENRLQQPNRRFTVGDVATLTGLPVDDAQRLLEQAMQLYDCRLQVTEAGGLVYNFGEALHRRGEPTSAERWAAVKQWLWQAFKVGFRVCISVMLLVYFVVFFVILLVLLLALLAQAMSDSDSDADIDFGTPFAILGEIIRGIFWWNVYSPATYYDQDDRGYAYRRYQAKDTAENKLGRRKKRKKGQDDGPPDKTFVASVYDFVFGPPRVEPPPLANQKEVAAFLRRNQAVIGPPEVRALAGWEGEAADDFFTDCVVRFNGQAQLSENGVLYAEFPDLELSANAEKDAPVVWYWDEYEPPYPLTGNGAGRNAAIVGLNAFNLVASGAVLVGALGNLGAVGSALLGWVPFLYSLTFFAVPGLRYFNLLPRRAQRQRNNVRKRLMRVLYRQPQAALSLPDLVAQANQLAKGEAPLTVAEAEPVFSQLVHELQGEAEAGDQGQVVYRFPRLAYELAEFQRLRSTRGPAQMGRVVFDTRD